MGARRSTNGAASGRNLRNTPGTCRALNSTISISIEIQEVGMPAELFDQRSRRVANELLQGICLHRIQHGQHLQERMPLLDDRPENLFL